jgi:hydrogenase maturation protease
MALNSNNVLLIGFGNPGRRDDGLGPALAEAVERLGIPHVTVEADYQLSVEDAAQVAEHDIVVFADADTAGPAPLSFQQIEPVRAVGFSSHSVRPPALLALAADLFGKTVPGYLLRIRGYAFNEYAERLSDRAKANLEAAIQFIEPVLRNGEFDRAAQSKVNLRSKTDLSSEGMTCKTASM